MQPLLKKFIVFAKDRLNFKDPPRLFLKRDSKNANCALGKTAHYDPQHKSITLYVTNRHPKDILRSFAHELVHHCQNERGDLSIEKMKTLNKNYAQENDHMRKMEEEAYLQGNMCFRDWEDGLDNKLQYKLQIAEQKFLKENNNMSVKISKRELKGLIEKLLNERVKKDANDRVQGRRAGGRRLKPLEETEELDENGCGGKGKKEDGGAEKKVDCENCKGKGCEQCKKPLEEGAFCCGEAGCGHPGDPAKLEEGEGHGKCINGCQCEPALEEGAEHDEDGDGDADSNDYLIKRDKAIKKAKANEKTKKENKIYTPEQENSLYESRFTDKNNRLFEKLLKKWAK